MSKVYEGDERKRCGGKEAGRTRAAEQAHIDTEFCNGRMSREEWRKRTDELSELTKWSVSGRIG